MHRFNPLISGAKLHIILATLNGAPGKTKSFNPLISGAKLHIRAESTLAEAKAAEVSIP